MSGRGWLFVFILALAAGAGALAFVRAEGTPPTLEAPEAFAVGADGRALTVAIADEGSGLQAFTATLRHAQGETVLVDETFPGSVWSGGTSEPRREMQVELVPKALGLGDGDAFLVLSVRDWSWRGGFSGNETRIEVPVAVDTRRPRIDVASGLTYVRRGGSGAVAYRLSEKTERDGVEVGEVFFPGYAAPSGQAGQRVAIFAVPTDAPRDPPVRVVAEDAAGNRASASWALVVQERALPEADVRLPQSFLEGKARDLAEAQRIDTSDLVQAFDAVNTKLRAANEARIREVVADTRGERLWTGAFAQLANSQVTSRFAEKRTYYVDGEPVSNATHFGYDLASTSSAPITAASAGRVLYADDLGIYGNCVLIDHGLGVSTLYGHLSRLDVAAGDTVEEGQTLGLSGATGLAGGDHLHFAVLVGTHYVDPLEWWDAEWMRTHVDRALAPPPAP